MTEKSHVQPGQHKRPSGPEGGLQRGLAKVRTYERIERGQEFAEELARPVIRQAAIGVEAVGG